MFEQQFVERLDLIAAPRLLRGHATLRAPQLPRLVVICSSITRANLAASRTPIILFIVLIVRAVERLDQIASAWRCALRNKFKKPIRESSENPNSIIHHEAHTQAFIHTIDVDDQCVRGGASTSLKQQRRVV